MTAVKIPKYIHDYIIQFKYPNSDNFSIIKSISSLQEFPKCKEWFDKISKKYNAVVTPHLVYVSSIRKGLSTYEPAFCRNCGKQLTAAQISSKRSTCSMKCTKALPEVRARASANMKNPEVLEKRRQTWLKKYGVANPMRNDAVKKKHRQTCMETYGTEFVFQSKEFKDKRHQTCLEKYGIAEPFAVDSIKKKALKNAHISRMYNYYDTFIELLRQKNITTTITREQYAQHTGNIELKCLTCGHTWIRNKEDEIYGFTAQFIGCPNCTRDNTSYKELAVAEYIKSIYKGAVEQHNRTILFGKELDIYLPEKNLAIEFDGIYWHRTERAGIKYHQLKTLHCREQGIRLIHIFEHEWNFKREKVCNLLRNALGIFDQQIYARQCKVKEISSDDYKTFLEINHFNGFVNSSIRYGLFYNNELVSVIGFGKSRFKKDEIELHRYCVKSGYRITGGFSKLLKHACKEARILNFVSYVDLAHFSGTGYETLGFKLIKITKPSYVYVKKSLVLSRIACQKHKLNNLLEKFDSNMTEQQNMLANGYIQIYDCGNLKLEYTV